MNKSFSYDSSSHTFTIARHQVGDFGFHLSLIRSVSWGGNMLHYTPQMSGTPLTYHYYFYLIVGLMEKIGIRIDIALNSLSALSYSILLFMVYKISLNLFHSTAVGIITLLLSITESSFSFLDTFSKIAVSSNTFTNTLRSLWYLPDYTHQGPVDGSLISLVFTQNALLNQRHLIAGLAIFFTYFYLLLPLITGTSTIRPLKLIIMGILFGVSIRIHALIYIGSIFVFAGYVLFYRQVKFLYFLLSAIAVGTLLIIPIISQSPSSIHFYPGFLSPRPFNIFSFLLYWWVNTGVVSILFVLAMLSRRIKNIQVAYPFLGLFILANIVQFSFIPLHNHALFRMVFIVVNMYAAFFLWNLYKQGAKEKVIAFFLFFLLTISGVLDLLVIKNDFHYPVADAPADPFVEWVRTKTKQSALFLSPPEFYDPVLLAGRSTYLGSSYYLVERGYDILKRQQNVNNFYSANSIEVLDAMRKEHINYIVIPIVKKDFPYTVSSEFFSSELQEVYNDNRYTVFAL